MALYHALLLSLVVAASTETVRPVEKVVNLITGLKEEVEKEGAEEANTYDKFSCFCKDTTMKKSQSVKDGNDKINDLSAEIADRTQSKKNDETELGDRKKNQEKLAFDLDEHNTQCAKEKAAYEVELADLNKAVSSLESAIKAMTSTGGQAAASFVEIRRTVLSVSAAVQKTAATETYLAALRKVDPDSPEYGYHSQDIIDLCKSLLVDFKNQRSELNTEWGKTDKSCKETKASLEKEMKSNKRNMEKLVKRIETNAKKIAEAREDLVQSVADMKDDQLYLKDLTARCEDRANDYDQRSKMRSDELGALNSALEVLTKEVVGRDKDVNKRALLEVGGDGADVAPHTQVTSEEGDDSAASLSFLQGTLNKQRGERFLARTANDVSLEQKKNRAISLLRDEGRRLGSLTISAFAQRSAADPFKKVKGLIQKLIERLLEESAAEATKKGFCDEALGSARLERDNRFEQANDLSRDVKALEAKRDELNEEIDVLTGDLKTEREDLKTATEDREKEKSENEESIKVAKEGLEAVTEALLILKSFYNEAAKAASFTQASPVDEDTDGAGFSGSYKGKQGGMKAVFGLLEVIQSDFDRTVRTTEEEENKAHREFVEFSQTSKSSIASKSTKKELDEQDLKSTETSIKKKMSDLESTTDLLDKALQELEELKPTCIDTGMSYEDRVKKREDEIEALEKALKILS